MAEFAVIWCGTIRAKNHFKNNGIKQLGVLYLLEAYKRRNEDTRTPLCGRITFLRRPGARKGKSQTGKHRRGTKRRAMEGSLLSLVIGVLLLVAVTGSLAYGGFASATPTVISINPSSGAQGTTVNVTDLEGTNFNGTPTVWMQCRRCTPPPRCPRSSAGSMRRCSLMAGR